MLGYRVASDADPTISNRRRSAFLPSGPPKVPSKSGPRESQHTPEVALFELVTLNPDEPLTFADQQLIDAQAAALPPYESKMLSRGELIRRRVDQEIYLLTALHSHYRYPSQIIKQLHDELVSARIKQVDTFLNSLNLIIEDKGDDTSETMAVVSSSALHDMLDPTVWIPLTAEQTSYAELALALDHAQRNFTLVPGEDFTEFTYRLFRLKKQLSR